MILNNKHRIEELDILKALGIICMVSGHSGAPFTKFIYLFHMAIFFIASGFFYKDENSQNILSVFKSFWKKVKHLYIPVFIWNIIFTLLHNLFIHINIYTNSLNPMLIQPIGYYSPKDIFIKIVEGTIFITSTEQIFCTVWFLKVLFMISVCYLFFDYLIKYLFKKRLLLIQLIISILLLIFGFYCSKIFNNDFYGIARTSSFYCLYFIGYILRIYKYKYFLWNWKQYLPILLISFEILLWLNCLGSIELVQNRYENPIFLLLASLFGWIFLYSLSYFINKVSNLKNIILVIGRNTISVVILHFLSFKIVSFIIVSLYDLPSFCIAACPVLICSTGVWWLAYIFVGVMVPVLLGVIYNRFIGKIYSYIQLDKMYKKQQREI